LPESIRVAFNRIVIRLPPEEVCRSLGFFVAFACGFVHDGIDFALSESFLRFVDNHVFDNSYLSHLVPVDAHSLFLLVFVLDLKRPDSKYPQTALQKPKCITSFLSFFTRAPTMLATPTLLEINGSDPMFPYKVRCFLQA
jgi:hypothetical protein